MITPPSWMLSPETWPVMYTPPSPAESWLRLSARAPQRLRIGYTLSAPPGMTIDPEIKTGITNVLRTLQGAGHQIEEYSFRFDVLAGWQLYTSMGFVQTAFIYEAMEPFIGRKVTAADVEPATWSILNKGWNTSGVQHTSDVDALRVLSRRIAGGLAPCDVVVTPTLAQFPKPLGFYDMGDSSLDRFVRRLAEGAAFTYPFNFSGQPAPSLPVASSAGGLPIGVQFVGRYGDEATLLSLGTQLEQLLPWKGKRPPIARAARNG